MLCVVLPSRGHVDPRHNRIVTASEVIEAKNKVKLNDTL
jgi:hypothetical protein